MHALKLLQAGDLAIPASTAWCLSDLGECRGKQEIYTRQSPQRLKVLREHAMIESTVSSNRVEGVALEASRIKAVLAGPARRSVIAMRRRFVAIAMRWPGCIRRRGRSRIPRRSSSACMR
ncbi:MAG: hypothetical protein AW07_03729 [Candidatus Accumulibacter sp. SK-11]|nr:MAG: hypothetical protein AW07_03729 [Candidatus Accumulibacter sp. SK-11]